MRAKVPAAGQAMPAFWIGTMLILFAGATFLITRLDPLPPRFTQHRAAADPAPQGEPAPSPQSSASERSAWASRTAASSWPAAWCPPSGW